MAYHYGMAGGTASKRASESCAGRACTIAGPGTLAWTARNRSRQHAGVERDKLRDERRGLLHAHRAGAVPLDLLEEEQDRISRRLAFLDSGIDASQIEYDQAKAHLEGCLALAGNAHAIYMSLDDSLRRICDQAFFERINISEVEDTGIVDAQHGEPFDALFDPALQAEALTSDRRPQAGLDAPTGHVAGLSIQHWVGPVGLEPTTRGLKVRCSAN